MTDPERRRADDVLSGKHVIMKPLAVEGTTTLGTRTELPESAKKGRDRNFKGVFVNI
jgi:hypothetical protein